MNERRPRRTRRSPRKRTPRIWMILTGSVAVLVLAGTVFGVSRWLSRASSATADSAQQQSAKPASTVATDPPVAASAEPTVAQSAVPATPATPVSSLPDVEVKRYLGKVLHSVPNKKHEIALTLDDGPGEDTERVLEILAENHVHVTFFVVGRRANTHRQQVRDMAAQGHEVANHTWTHPEPGAITEAELMKQIDRNQKFITELTGRTPPFVRPRGGKFTDETMANLKERGLILANWSIHSNDVEPSPSVEQIVKNATGGASSGAIILMHETNPNTVLALPKILKELQRKGLKPVTLSELLADDSRASD